MITLASFLANRTCALRSPDASRIVDPTTAALHLTMRAREPWLWSSTLRDGPGPAVRIHDSSKRVLGALRAAIDEGAAERRGLHVATSAALTVEFADGIFELHVGHDGGAEDVRLVNSPLDCGRDEDGPKMAPCLGPLAQAGGTRQAAPNGALIAGGEEGWAAFVDALTLVARLHDVAPDRFVVHAETDSHWAHAEARYQERPDARLHGAAANAGALQGVLDHIVASHRPYGAHRIAFNDGRQATKPMTIVVPVAVAESATLRAAGSLRTAAHRAALVATLEDLCAPRSALLAARTA